MLRFFRLFPWFALAASLILFAVCLFNDGYYIAGSNPRAWSSSWLLLLLGWIGLPSGTVAWLANPAMLGAWVLFVAKKPALSLLAAAAACFFMLTFLLQQTVISSEAPTYSRIVGYGTGFWLWLASAATQLLGSAVAALPTEFLTSSKNAA